MGGTVTVSRIRISVVRVIIVVHFVILFGYRGLCSFRKKDYSARGVHVILLRVRIAEDLSLVSKHVSSYKADGYDTK